MQRYAREWSRIAGRHCSRVITCDLRLMRDTSGSSAADLGRVTRQHKVRFAAQVLRAAMRLRRRQRECGAVVVATHIRMASLAVMASLIANGRRPLVALHGFEAWHHSRLPPVWTLRRCTFLPVSNYTWDRFRSAFPGSDDLQPNGQVLRNCVADDLTALASTLGGGALERLLIAKHQRRLLMVVSRLDKGYEYKGVDTVLDALACLKLGRGEHHPPLQCVVVGDGSARPLYEQRARALQLDHVTFCGRISDEALAALYGKATLLVLPSRIDSDASGEGYGLVYIEAGLFYTPSIATRHGAAPEALGHGAAGWTLEQATAENVAYYIWKALSSYALWHEKALGAQRWASQHRPENFEKAVISLLTSQTNGRRR